MVAILIALTAVMFVLQHISPLDPVKAQLGAQASAAAVAARREALGLNEPIVVAVLALSAGAPHGDLGTSYRTRHPVASDLGRFFPATLELALYGIAIAHPVRAAGVQHDVDVAGSRRAADGALHGRVRADVPARHPRLIVFYKKLGWVPANGASGAQPAGGPPGC